MIFFGGSYARKAKAYIEETGDTEGIGFLAAGKAIRSVATTLFFIGVILTIIICGGAAVISLAAFM